MSLQNEKQQKNSQRPILRNRKGWKGFVWGYKDWLKATEDEGRWDAIEWGKGGKVSGAKKIEKVGEKRIYTY